jgi:hypothetical protein
MFFDGNFFWFLMGIVFVLILAGFKAFADDKGWAMTWWKWLLLIVWDAIFSLSFYAWGTLIGERENSAGFKIALLGLFICLILGVGIWRLVTAKPKAAPVTKN